jgi:hypothetical protein
LYKNIKLVLTLLFSISVIVVSLYFIDSKQERISNINLYIEGTIDPRLYAVAYNRYKPSILKGNDCSMSPGWTQGGGRQPRMDVIEEQIVPDENNYFKVQLPIIYTGKKRCGYVYEDTFIRISRNETPSLVSIAIMSSNNEYSHRYRGEAWNKNGELITSNLYYKKEGALNPNKYFNLKTPKKFYRISNDSKIECYTDYFEREDVVVLSCIPKYADQINGVDIIKTDTISLDILVSDDNNSFYFKNDGRKKDYFRFD